jgi:hypothetical protein
MTSLNNYRLAGHVAHMVELRNACTILVRNLKGRELRRPKRRGKNNFAVDLTEIGCETVDGVYHAEITDHWRVLVNAVMNRLVLLMARNFSTK